MTSTSVEENGSSNSTHSVNSNNSNSDLPRASSPPAQRSTSSSNQNFLNGETLAKLNERFAFNQDIVFSLEQFCSSNKIASQPYKDLFFRSAPNLSSLFETKQSLAQKIQSPVLSSSPKRASFDQTEDANKRSKRSKKSNLNNEVTLHVSFEESAEGGNKIVEYDRWEDCDVCSLSIKSSNNSKDILVPITDSNEAPIAESPTQLAEEMAIQSLSQAKQDSLTRISLKQEDHKPLTNPDCNRCKGTKRIFTKKRLDVQIPKGVTRGFRKVFKGEGHKGPDSTYGDLIIEFDVDDHPFFQRQSDDAACEVTVTVFQAVLGTKLQIPKLYPKDQADKLEIQIDPGTQPNQVVKVTNQGFTKANCKKKRGDLLVTVKVEIPRSVTREQRELFERLAAIDSMVSLSSQ